MKYGTNAYSFIQFFFFFFFCFEDKYVDCTPKMYSHFVGNEPTDIFIYFLLYAGKFCVAVSECLYQSRTKQKKKKEIEGDCEFMYSLN